MGKKTIKDVDLAGKRVLVRVDFNAPLEADGAIANDRRIQSALGTIRYCLERGAALILMSHLGRPSGDPEKDKPLRMDAVAKRLQELLGRPVRKVDAVTGPVVEEAARQLEAGQVLVLENLRFDDGEKDGDEGFARQLAGLADVYVNEAFGTCHRNDASMVAVPRQFPAGKRVAGLLLEKELRILDRLLGTPAHPMVAILGGAKVSDKILLIAKLLERCDRLLVGGAMTYTFMKAQGLEVGNSRVELDKLGEARRLLELAGTKLRLPHDHLVANSLLASAETQVVEETIPPGWLGVDIGPDTASVYEQEVAGAATVVWNGPMGKFEIEPFSLGTRSVAEALAASKATTVVGGGETAEAVEQWGLDGRMTHVSTGGGAFLEYLEGKRFESLEALDDA